MSKKLGLLLLSSLIILCILVIIYFLTLFQTKNIEVVDRSLSYNVSFQNTELFTEAISTTGFWNRNALKTEETSQEQTAKNIKIIIEDREASDGLTYPVTTSALVEEGTYVLRVFISRGISDEFQVNNLNNILLSAVFLQMYKDAHNEVPPFERGENVAQLLEGFERDPQANPFIVTK